MATRSKKNRGVPPGPTARRCAKLAEYSANVKNRELEVLAARADFGDISEVKKVPVGRQDRRKNRPNAIENAIYQLGDMLPGYLAKEVDMSTE